MCASVPPECAYLDTVYAAVLYGRSIVVPRTIRARRGPADRTSRPAPRRGGGGRGRAAAPHFARVRAIAQRAPIGPTMVRTKSC